ncbi:MAG: YceI family protein [Gemmatimonadetes bacterium]|nr:YceI family protein [Gemmatimonadota bacterium]
MKRAGSLAVAAVLVSLTGVPMAAAQEVPLVVDGRASLAWWQVNPYRYLLWGTTCPQDPSWRPGDGASQAGKAALLGLPGPDTVNARHVRRRATTLCDDGVSGQLVAGDTAAWRSVRGTIVLRANALVSGLDMRDTYTRRVVLETARYPVIRFTIDSLVQVEGADSIRALALGTFELRGVKQPMTVPVRAWREVGGLRVRAWFGIPVRALAEQYHVSRAALGLAIQKGMWSSIEVGVDLVLRPAPSPVVASGR